MRKIIAFSGPSNSGKTTLILRLNELFLKQGLKTLVVKHDPGDKAKFDVAGKDSFKFFDSGADVIVLSPTRTSYFSHKKSELESAVKLGGEFDICMVEGLKSLDLPRISVFKDELDTGYFAFSNAIASYKMPNLNGEFTRLKWLNLDDIQGIADYTLKTARII